MKHKPATTVTIRLLERRLDELLAELRVLAPDLVKQLEQTMAALREQPVERGEYEGLDRGAAIHARVIGGVHRLPFRISSSA